MVRGAFYLLSAHFACCHYFFPLNKFEKIYSFVVVSFHTPLKPFSLSLYCKITKYCTPNFK